MSTTATVRVACSPGERRVAVTRSGRLLDYGIDRDGDRDGVGDRHVGRVTAWRRALAGAFVALDGGLTGFLPDSAGGAGVTEGMFLRIGIARAAHGGKGPRLTSDGAADGPARLLEPGPDAVARMAARYPDAAIEADDAAFLRPDLGGRLRHVRAAFDEATESAVDALGRPDVSLPGGARATITPTPALVAIDIDLAAAASGRGAAGATHAAVNAALLPALARAIRLRNLGGAILIDFAGLPAKRRSTLGPALAAAVATDPVRTRVLGFTALGLAELVRDRIHAPLHERLAGPHPAALTALRALARAIAADPRIPPALIAGADVADALVADAVARADLARRAGRPLMLTTDRALPSLAWRLP